MEYSSDISNGNLLTFAEAAQYLRIATYTLTRLDIPCSKLGKVVYYKKRDLDNISEFLEFKPYREWKRDNNEEEDDEQ